MTQNRASSAQVSRIIRERRIEKDLTQEQLAEYIGVSDRAVRKWETGEDSPSSIHRKALANFLGILPETLGLPEQTDYSREDAFRILDGIKISLDKGAFITASSTSASLVPNLIKQVHGGATDLLVPLIHAQYLAGLAISITEDNPFQAWKYFKHMERSALQLADHVPLYVVHTYLCIALTYQGEMLRRMDRYSRAIDAFKKVPQGPDIDIRARGNYIQLFGRTHASVGDMSAAESAMRQAEELAFREGKHTSSIYVCFNPCSVYEEWAKLYMKRNTRKSLKYIEMAEEQVLVASRWLIPLQLTKGEVLMRAVLNAGTNTPKSLLNEPDFLAGLNLFKAGSLLALESGHQRQLQRTQHVVKDLGWIGTRYSEASRYLDETLYELMSLNRAAK